MKEYQVKEAPEPIALLPTALLQTWPVWRIIANTLLLNSIRYTAFTQY